ncbi:ABC transporter permease [Pseudomonas solani]|uniref:ABC transporter permease n=1 Tax=Pseudomonas solani TaxID=2731552 RepID=UPI003F4ABDBA
MTLLESAPAPSLTQLLHEALGSLRNLGRRSLLALLGIVMGSCSVIALLNIGQNAADQAMSVFREMGTEAVVVQLPSVARGSDGLPLVLDGPTLEASVPGIEHVSPLVLYSSQVVFHGRTRSLALVGADASLGDAARLRVAQGRYLSAFDARQTFVVVGAQAALALGVPGDPLQLGDRVRIDDYQFQVIGILKPQGAGGIIPFTADDALFLPPAGMARINPAPSISTLIARVVPGQDVATIGERLLQRVNREIAGEQKGTLQVAQQMIDAMQQQTRTFTYLLAALGGISLVGGGVGVMNVMLMNVSERRREIGVRMALGARRRDIRNLFLLEAVTLTAAGAVSGALLGVAAAWGYARLCGWDFALASSALPLGIGSTLLVGLFFGLHPAISAARLQPVEALRDA